eukprot:Filipodium_phascolosomae@DN202_c0_g1_i2.p1
MAAARVRISGEAAWIGIVLSVVAVACYIASMASSSWRQNPPGINFYFSARTWGLFVVRGVTTQTHWKLYTQSCEFAGMHSTLGNPLSPLAMWYTQKCTGWHWMFITSTVVAAFLAVLIAVQVASFFLFLKFTYQPVLSSVATAMGGVFLAGCIGIGFVIGTDMAFQEVESVAVFHRPELWVSFYIFLLGVVCDIFATVCKVASFWTLKKIKDLEEEAYEEAYDLYSEAY